MPATLTVSGFTKSGHTYDEKLGAHSPLPVIYRSPIKSGETAVFCAGKCAYPGKAPLSYLGTAIVSQVSNIIDSADRHTLLQYKFRLFQEFQAPVPFKLGEVYCESLENLHRSPRFTFPRGQEANPRGF